MGSKRNKTEKVGPGPSKESLSREWQARLLEGGDPRRELDPTWGPYRRATSYFQSPVRARCLQVWAAGQAEPYPHAGLSEVGPHGNLFARAHVGVAIPLEGGLQLLQLLASEVRTLPPLLLLQRAVLGGAPRQ